MRRWNEAEYDVLFRDHPPTRPNAPDLATSRDRSNDPPDAGCRQRTME